LRNIGIRQRRSNSPPAKEGCPKGGVVASSCALGAWRRGPGKVCRNSFTGLVMLPGLELWTSFALRAGDGREANDARLSQTADSPRPDHADTLEAVREDC